jgi:hypothetical protein
MRMPMPTEFHYEQEIDIFLLQEVTPNGFGMLRGYNAYRNDGIKKRDATMFTRETIKLTNLAVAIRTGNGSVLPRRLYSEYIYTVWLIE